MRRPNRLGVSPVSMGNSGIPGPSKTATIVNIDSKMDMYDAWVAINEQTTLYAQDPILTMYTELLGMDLRETEDLLTRDMLASTATSINCTYGTNGQLPTNASRSDLDLVYRTLRANNAKTITPLIPGADKFGTGPVRNCYLAMCHVDLTPDLQNVYGWKNVCDYPNQNNIGQSEEGNIGNIRFWTSSVGSVIPNASSTGQNVYNIFTAGVESFGVVDQENYPEQYRYSPKEYDRPLMLNATAAYVTAMVPRLLNDAWILAVRATLLIS